MKKLMGLREYARYRNCSLSAVQKALSTGRISHIIVDGKKKIDPSIADEEWQANTHPVSGLYRMIYNKN